MFRIDVPILIILSGFDTRTSWKVQPGLYFMNKFVEKNQRNDELVLFINFFLSDQTTCGRILKRKYHVTEV